MSWIEDVIEESLARGQLWCRMIGGQFAGKCYVISNQVDVFEIPIWKQVPVENAADKTINLIPMEVARYYRTENPCDFEAG